MNAVSIAMLVCGIVLFVFVLGLLVYLVINKRSAVWLLPLFVVAIIMIGFPAIQSFKIGGAEVDLKSSLDFANQHPGDTTVTNQLAQSVDQMESLITTNGSTAAVAEQIARGNEILGRTDQAIQWAGAALNKSPGSTTAQELLARVQIQKLIPPNLTKVTPEARPELVKALSALNQQSNLSADSHLTLSRAQWVLGQTNEAVASLRSAFETDTNLHTSPKAAILLEHIPNRLIKP